METKILKALANLNKRLGELELKFNLEGGKSNWKIWFEIEKKLEKK